MGCGHSKQHSYGMSKHCFNAAPRVYHFSLPLKVFQMELMRHIYDRRESHSVVLRFMLLQYFA